jgi:isoleucyl-tRNA synthetase
VFNYQVVRDHVELMA